MWSRAQQADAGGSRRVVTTAGAMRRHQRTIVTVVALADIDPNPEQPRKHFPEETLAELAQSIRQRGLLQPVVVRRTGARYQILAGERRFRAAQRAGLDRLPAVVREHGDALEIALIENVQREDLGPLEEAEALAALIERHGYSHREVAHLLGKSRPYVSNILALNRLPPAMKDDLAREGATFSREVLIGIARQPDPQTQTALWSRLKLDAMSVRRFREEHGPARERPAVRDALVAARRLNRRLRRLGDAAMAAEDLPSLRRALRRTRRLLDRVMPVLEN